MSVDFRVRSAVSPFFLGSAVGTTPVLSPKVSFRGLAHDTVQFSGLSPLRFSAKQYPSQSKRLIVVANREPCSLRKNSDGTYQLSVSAGGLVSGTAPALGDDDIWVSRQLVDDPNIPFDKIHGMADQLSVEDRKKLPVFALGQAPISKAQEHGHYNKISNGLLWPVMHNYLEGMDDFSSQDWLDYQAVNQEFANTVATTVQSGDVVWVHDYQLMQVPQKVRDMVGEKAPGSEIRYFHHIPFPSYDILKTIPFHKALLKGLMGADLVGFHTPEYVDEFLNAVQKTFPDEVKVDLKAQQIRYQGRTIQVGDFPISIDAQKIQAIKKTMQYKYRLSQYKSRYPYKHIGIGVDRLDYSKGIKQRLQAIRKLLRENPEYINNFKFIQIAAPSRQSVPAYQQLENDVVALVQEINQEFGDSKTGWTPIEFIHKDVPFEDIVPLFELASFAMVTPIKDGMNLVAKEFCAAQNSVNPGALILSELAGAAGELNGALMVNPFNQEQIVEALKTAMQMTPKERWEHMQPLQEQVFSHDVHVWRENFLQPLSQIAKIQKSKRVTDPKVRTVIDQLNTHAQPKLLMFDYDGTLRQLVNRPEEAYLPRAQKAMLRALVQRATQYTTDQGTPDKVVIVSGRPVETLKRFLTPLIEARLPLMLVGLHGGEVYDVEKNEMLVNPGESYRAPVQALKQMLEEQDFTSQFPGVTLEDKTHTLALHLRNANSKTTKQEAIGMFRAIARRRGLLNQFELRAGKEVVELVPKAFNKGKAVTWLMRYFEQQYDETFYPAFFGDDVTDEDAFSVVNQYNGLSVRIGKAEKRNSNALTHLKNVPMLYQWVRKWVELGVN